MEKPRVLITVSGGVVQCLDSDCDEIECYVIDYDNIEAGGENKPYLETLNFHSVEDLDKLLKNNE